MSIAYDNESTIGLGTGDRNWNHTPSGTPRGVLVIIVDGVTTDQVVGVTYGGSAMTEVSGSPNVLSGGEGGAVHVFWKGSSIATGTQAVAVDRGDTTSWDAVCYTVTADSDTYIHNVQTSSSTATTSPGGTLVITEEAFVAGGVYSGENSPGTSAPTGAQNTITLDFGTDTGAIARGTSIKTADYAFTWSQASNDGVAIVVAMAQKQKYVWAQAQAQIKVLAVKGYAQAQAQIAGAAVSRYKTRVLGDSPVGYWRLDEASGNPQDSSGNGNHATASFGTPTYSETGALGSESNAAITFDGSTEYFTVPDPGSDSTLDVGDGPVSIEFWAKRTGSGGGAWDIVVAKYANSFAVGFDTSDRFAISKSGVVELAYQSTATTDTSWHYYVATKNGTSLVLYKDGVDINATISSTTALADNNSVLEIGAENTGIKFQGTLDELAIYKSVLSATQVQDHWTVASHGGVDRFAQAKAQIAGNYTLKYSQALADIKQTYPHNFISTDDYYDLVMSHNPVAYWRLNEASGSVADNEIGTLNGTYSGVSGYQDRGPLARDDTSAGPYFPNSGSITVPDDASIDLGDGPLTYEMWVKNSNPNNAKYFMTKGTFAPGLYYAGNNDLGKVYWIQYGNYNAVKSTITIKDSTWHHIVGTKDTSDNWLIYIDGVECSEIINTGVSSASTDSDLTICTDLDGTVSEVAIYDSVLTAAQIKAHFVAAQSHYARQILADNPIGYWRLGETTGSSYANEYFGRAPLSLYNTPTQEVEGPIHSDKDWAMSFDRASTEYLKATSTTIPAGTMAGVSVEAWIKLSTPLTNGEELYIVSWDYASYSDNYLGFYFTRFSDNYPEYIGFQWGDGTAPRNWYYTPYITDWDMGIDDGNWHHLAAVHDYNAQTITFYVDGTDVSAIYPWGNGEDPATYPPIAPIAANQPIAIGMYAGNELYGFDGAIDEVAIYNYPLTASQIRVHAEIGKTGTTSPTFAQAQARILKQTYPLKGYSETILNTSGLQNYYRLNESYRGSTTAVDSKSGYNGTYTNNPTRGYPGGIRRDSATSTVFHWSANTSIIVPHNAFFDWANGARTIELWFNRYRIYNMQYTYLISKSGWGQIHFNSDNQIELEQDGSVSATSSTSYGVPGPDNRTVDGMVYGWTGWHHLVATHDPNESQYHHIYIDGVDVTTNNNNNTFYNDSHDLYIGRYYNDGNPQNFNGALQEIALYNRALTLTEAKSHYELGVAEFFSYDNIVKADNPVGYWRLGDTSGTTMVDEIAGNNGTYQTGYTLNETGALGGDTNKAVEFNYGYATIPYTSALQLGNGPLSIEFWYNRAVSDMNGEKKILDIVGSNGYQVTDNGTGILSLQAAGQSGSVSNTSALTYNTWYHVVITYENDTASIYINGYDQTGTRASPPQNMANATGPIVLGAHRSMSGEYFIGSLDELAIYNYVLSSEKVAGHYIVGRSSRISSTPFAQAMATIKATMRGFAQALAEVKSVYQTRIIADAPVAYWRLGDNEATSEYYNTIVAAKPVGYWRLGEASGNLASNSGAGMQSVIDYNMGSIWEYNHINLIDGTYVDSPTLGATGAIISDSDKAVTLNNTTQYVRIPDTHDLWWTNRAEENFSVEAWFKTTDSGWGIIAAKKGDTSLNGTDPGWFLGLNDTSEFVFGISDGSATAYGHTPISNPGAKNFRDGKWHHIVAVNRNTNPDNSMQIWVDGVTLESPVTTGGVDWQDYYGPLKIGFVGEASSYFNGTLDEVAVYDYALLDGQIMDHYLKGTKSAKNFSQSGLTVADSFSRSSASSWTSASEIGGTWYDTSDTSHWTVDGSVGQYTMTYSNGIVTDNIQRAGMYKDTVQTIKWRLDKLKTGGTDALWMWFNARVGNNLDVPDYWRYTGYIGGFGVYASGDIYIGFQKGDHSYIDDYTNIGTYTANDWWWAKFEVVGATLKIKAWKDGTSEPSWQVVWTDPDNSFPNAGFNGIGVYTDATTNAPIVYSFDSYSVLAYDLSTAYMNNPTRGVTGAITGDNNGAVTFDGTNEVEVLTSSVSNYSRLDLGDGPFSIEFWVKRTSGGMVNFEPVLGKWSSAYGVDLEESTYGPAPGVVYLRSSAYQLIAQSNTGITDTNWHHVVITYNGGSSTLFYIDNVESHTHLNTVVLTDNEDNALKLGASWDYGRHLNGSLDEVALYNYILTPIQVQDHWTLANTKASARSAQAMATITGGGGPVTYRGFAQAQATIKAFAVKGYAQAQATIRVGGRGYAQAQARIRQTYRGFAQAQTRIRQTYRGYGQAFAQIRQTYRGYAQSQARIRQTYQGYAQAQAKIKGIAVKGYAQAQAQIRATYRVFAQAQAQIKQTYRGYAQAQAQIISTFQKYAQAQAQIRATYQSYAQAQAQIKTTYRGHAQALGHIKVTDINGYAQAQGLIRQTVPTFAQALALVYIPVYYSPTADVSNDGWVRTVNDYA